MNEKHKKPTRGLSVSNAQDGTHSVCAGMPMKAANIHFCCITCQKS